jgi:hypothetical protein
MDKRTTIIVVGIGVLQSPTIDASGLIRNAPGILPTDALLYFTSEGCVSMPLVGALDESGQERSPDERFSATDGYDYAIIEGTRETRPILSRFTGVCEDISPLQLDTYRAFEVGVTSLDEPEVEI